jgi:hypothetical protein
MDTETPRYKMLSHRYAVVTGCNEMQDVCCIWNTYGLSF